MLPAATWYEKHDLSSTDMHPFHALGFDEAVNPPGRTDFEVFQTLAHLVGRLADHLGTQTDVVVEPLSRLGRHDHGERRRSPEQTWTLQDEAGSIERDATRRSAKA